MSAPITPEGSSMTTCPRHPPSPSSALVCHTSHRQTLYERFICLWFAFSQQRGTLSLVCGAGAGRRSTEKTMAEEHSRRRKAWCTSRDRLGYTSVTTMSTSCSSGFRQHRSNFPGVAPVSGILWSIWQAGVWLFGSVFHS